jgi:hypothetical protein
MARETPEPEQEPQFSTCRWRWREDAGGIHNDDE